MGKMGLEHLRSEGFIRGIVVCSDLESRRRLCGCGR